MEKILIGKVAKSLGVSTRTIRYYEDLGLISPSIKNQSNNYRYYTLEDIEKLKKILYLKELDFSLEEIKTFMTSPDSIQQKILNEKYNTKYNEYMFIKKYKDDRTVNLDKKFNHSTNFYKNVIGVWQLQGMYNNYKDAKKDLNPLNFDTPYLFLAFDEDGHSPWFYNIDGNFIKFDTKYKPLSEKYKIIDNSLFLKISIPDEHIFFLSDKIQTNKHLLKFTKISDNYEDYKKFLIKDEKPIDNNTIKIDNGFYKIVGWTPSLTSKKITFYNKEQYSGFEILDKKMYDYSKQKEYLVINDGFYDEKEMLYSKFNIVKLDENYIFVENKTRTYTFTGFISKIYVYKKI